MKKVRSKLRPTEIGVVKTFSLSPNDEIGEIAVECTGCTYYYSSLEELCEKWQDYEEPKGYWYVDAFVNIIQNKITKHRGDAYTDMSSDYEMQKSIGNYFETKEEAEKAVEKLKAWKRLRDKGFRFNNWDLDADDEDINVLLSSDAYKGNKVYDFAKDLDLLFGGEE